LLLEGNVIEAALSAQRQRSVWFMRRNGRLTAMDSAEGVEWLWHVDEQDWPVGRVARHVAHNTDVRHRSGVVLLADDLQRIYLTMRAANKQLWPNTYDASASFHVTYEETYAMAAERETHEELGLTKPLQYLGKFSHYDRPERQFVAVFAMRYAGETLVLDALEASGGAFYTRTEVARILAAENCTPWLTPAIQLYWNEQA
jgi:isopentenyldiphosphate isomerase